MIYEGVYVFLYRVIVVLFSVIVVSILVRTRDRATQVAGTMTLIPLLLRALGAK